MDAVETMAYTGQVPWHGLGTEKDKDTSFEEWIKAAGLDWRVETRPVAIPSSYSKIIAENGEAVVTYGDFDLEVPEHFALTRSTDGKVFDLVGNRYQPTQNAELLEFFREFVEEGDANIETLGSLRGGQFVWALANLGESFELPGGDVVKGYVLIGSPHKKGRSLLIRQTSVRVVCWNTLAMALRQAGTEWRMPHRREFNATAIQEAKLALGLAREGFSEFEETARELKAMTLAADDAVKILASILDPKADDEKLRLIVSDLDEFAPRPLVKVLDSYTKAPGADPGTGWGVFNAITHYADHVASRTQDQRMQEAWFGTAAKTKERALELLLK